jgi:SAM-dependent methyltransferase
VQVILAKSDFPKGFDRVADVYDATRSLAPDLMAKLVSGVSREVRAGATILDVGVGTGRFALPLAKKGFRVTGIDVSRLMLTKAREKGVKSLLLGSAQSLPMKDRVFDYSIFVHFLHLVDDWASAVREIGRVTDDSVLSIVQRVQGTRLRLMYIDIREGMGYPWPRLKRGDEQLADFVKERKRVMLAQYTDTVDLEEELGDFQRRLHSSTWDLPDDVHSRIIREMRMRLEGSPVQRSHEFFLLSWNPADLARFDPSA